MSYSEKSLDQESDGIELSCFAPTFSLTAVATQPTRHLIGAAITPAVIGMGASLLSTPIAASSFDEVRHR